MKEELEETLDYSDAAEQAQSYFQAACAAVRSRPIKGKGKGKGRGSSKGKGKGKGKYSTSLRPVKEDSIHDVVLLPWRPEGMTLQP